MRCHLRLWNGSLDQNDDSEAGSSVKRIGKTVRPHLQKALDSALLAVEVYNKPATTFKSEAYIMLMIIAWTALFHAIFFRRRIKPYRKESNGRRYVRVDHDYKHWELAECLRAYYKSDTGNLVRKNLEFFIPLRNKIEHRHLPELDADIFGECQAMLLNFDEIVTEEFGQKYCLRESLSFSLQLFPSTEGFAASAKQSRDHAAVKNFIENYRSSISADALNSGKYAFKAFLIQVANHQSKEALPIQFVQYDKLSEEQRQEVDKLPALIKYKQVPVANPGAFMPSKVAEKVQVALGNPIVDRNGKDIDKFNTGVHTLCWKKYGVRPSGSSSNPETTDTRYCTFDAAHGDYLYTKAWVDFLVGKMSDEKEYLSLFVRRD